MASISGAAARDDIYDLTELAHANRTDAAKLAKIARALEQSIPRLDPVRFRREFEHVLAGPDLPELEIAKQMARAVLEGRPVESPAGQDDGEAPPAGFLTRMFRMSKGDPGTAAR